MPLGLRESLPIEAAAAEVGKRVGKCLTKDSHVVSSKSILRRDQLGDGKLIIVSFDRLLLTKKLKQRQRGNKHSRTVRLLVKLRRTVHVAEGLIEGGRRRTGERVKETKPSSRGTKRSVRKTPLNINKHVPPSMYR